MSLALNLLLALFLIASPLSATEQEPDRIFIKGGEYSLLDFPPISPPESVGIPSFKNRSTANWRSYVAHWEIDHDKLWLRSIDGLLLIKPATKDEIRDLYIKMRKPDQPEYDPAKEYPFQRYILNQEESRLAPATLELICPGLSENGRVFVNWFSGELRVGYGGHYFSEGKTSGFKYRRIDIYFVTKGIVKRKQTILHPASVWEATTQ